MNRAVVVGLCAHGLAIVRALADEGLDVIAAESNLGLPGCSTSKATVARFSDVNVRETLVKDLVRLAEARREAERPVLFLTNDRMVRIVGEEWETLKDHYLLSWGECTRNVVNLLDKSQIEKTCLAANVRYPRSAVLNSADDSQNVVPFPAIIKPVNPLGAFKAIVIKDEAELSGVLSRYRSSFPFLLQEWLPGGHEHLMVSALVLNRGRILARFDGRKLASRPRLTGQTSVMEYRQGDGVFEIARRFFTHADVSGPAAIEVKQGADGEYYVIEPTVGRSDYFVDAMISNGVNFPYAEYRLAIGKPVTALPAQDRAVWFDTERDKFCFIRLHHRLLNGHAVRRPVFPYLRSGDMHPWAVSQKRLLASLWSRFIRKRRKLQGKEAGRL